MVRRSERIPVIKKRAEDAKAAKAAAEAAEAAKARARAQSRARAQEARPAAAASAPRTATKRKASAVAEYDEPLPKAIWPKQQRQDAAATPARAPPARSKKAEPAAVPQARKTGRKYKTAAEAEGPMARSSSTKAAMPLSADASGGGTRSVYDDVEADRGPSWWYETKGRQQAQDRRRRRKSAARDRRTEAAAPSGAEGFSTGFRLCGEVKKAQVTSAKAKSSVAKTAAMVAPKIVGRGEK
jgi:colicin import membrane protein